MIAHTVRFDAQMAVSGGPLALGSVVVKNTTDKYVIASAANRTTYGRAHGIALGSADDLNTAFELMVGGVVPNAITKLGAGAVSWVRTSAAGGVERCTPGGGDDVLGRCNAAGDLWLQPGTWDSTITGGGVVTSEPASTTANVSRAVVQGTERHITTTAGGVTLTLPATPVDAEFYEIKSGGAWNTTIAGNGHNVDGAATYTQPFNYDCSRVRFSAAAGQWELV